MKISPKELNENIFRLIGDDWMLITAGDQTKVNTMTASFGGFGIFCFKNVAHIYVRPERYTYSFLESSDTFSLSFFDETFKEKLTYCGRISGKDEDKISNCDFDTLFTDDGTPYFKQARITIICKKMYAQDIDESCFYDKTAFEKTYTHGGLHKMYIGEILDIII